MESRKRSYCSCNLHSCPSKMMRMGNSGMSQKQFSFRLSSNYTPSKFQCSSSGCTDICPYDKSSCLLPSLFMKYYGFQRSSFENYLNEID